jgi:hypothetical protein
MTRDEEILERASAALLVLATEGDWRDISLRTVAEKAGVDLADLFPLAPGRTALLAHISRGFDKAALAPVNEDSSDAHDRLFEATMARVEAMQPHRAALIAISRAESVLTIASHLPRTARAILEGAGVNATPLRLTPRCGVTTKERSTAPWPKSTCA